MIITTLLSIILLIMGWYFLRSFREPGLCLSVVWSSYAIEQLLQAKFPIFLNNGAAFNFGIGGFVSLTVVYLLLSGKVRWANLTQSAAIYYMLLGWACMTYLWSIDQGITFQNLRSSFPYIVIFAILAPFLIRTPKDLIKCCNGTVILGVFVMLGHAAFELTGFRGRSIEIHISSSEQLHLNPLAVASFGGFVSICTSFWIYQNRKANLIRLLIAGAIITLGLYTIVRSGSRGQMIALVCSLIIWIPITAQMALKKQAIVALLMAVGVAFGAIYMIDVVGWSGNWEVDSFLSSFSGRLATSQGALSEYASGTGMQWIIGQGSSSSWRSLGGYPHNVPVEILLEQGVVGLLFFCGFVFSITFEGFRILLDKRVDDSSRLVLGLILCLFTFNGILLLKQGAFLGATSFFGIGVSAAIIFKQIRYSQRLSEAKMRYLERASFGSFAHQPNQLR